MVFSSEAAKGAEMLARVSGEGVQWAHFLGWGDRVDLTLAAAQTEAMPDFRAGAEDAIQAARAPQQRDQSLFLHGAGTHARTGQTFTITNSGAGDDALARADTGARGGRSAPSAVRCGSIVVGRFGSRSSWIAGHFRITQPLL